MPAVMRTRMAVGMCVVVNLSRHRVELRSTYIHICVMKRDILIRYGCYPAFQGIDRLSAYEVI